MCEKSVKIFSCLSKHERENNTVSGPSVLHWVQPRNGGSEVPDSAQMAGPHARLLDSTGHFPGAKVTTGVSSVGFALGKAQRRCS